MLGRTPDALAALDRDLGAYRHVVEVTAQPVTPSKHEGQKARCELRTVGTSNGDDVLDVPAYIGEPVVHDGDEQDSLAEDARRMKLVTRKQPLRLFGVDREGGHEGWAVLRIYG
jgi:hypothetical protein